MLIIILKLELCRNNGLLYLNPILLTMAFYQIDLPHLSYVNVAFFMEHTASGSD